MSNSSPSQPGNASAARKAAIVFSGARRQSPRCASRSARGLPALDDVSVATTSADGQVRREPEVIRRVEAWISDGGPIEYEPAVIDDDRPPEPDVVETPGRPVGIDRRREEPRRPGHVGLRSVGLAICRPE